MQFEKYWKQHKMVGERMELSLTRASFVAEQEKGQMQIAWYLTLKSVYLKWESNLLQNSYERPTECSENTANT